MYEQELRDRGKTGKYMLHNFGTIDESSNPNSKSFMLNLKYDHVFNTFVSLKIDASEIVFVYNV